MPCWHTGPRIPTGEKSTPAEPEKCLSGTRSYEQNMILVEPEAAYIKRLGLSPSGVVAAQIQAPRPPCATVRPHFTGDDFWADLLISTLRKHGDEPVAIVRLVNELAQWGDFSSRRAREAKKVELLKLIGALSRSGRLRRFARKCVVIGKPGAAAAHRPEVILPVLDLPQPNI